MLTNNLGYFGIVYMYGFEGNWTSKGQRSGELKKSSLYMNSIFYLSLRNRKEIQQEFDS